MRRTRLHRRAIAALAVALLLASPAGAVSGSAPQPAPRAHANAAAERHIVVLRDGVDARGVIADYSGALRAGRRYRSVFTGFTATMSAATATVVAADPRVAAVEADGRMYRLGAQGWPTWGLDRIDQPGRNLDQTYAYATKGRGVAAYVVDGGVFARHREFGDRVVKGFDATGQGAGRDCDGHGTHIAGTIGGRRFGVAKKVRIVPVRVADCSEYIRRSDVVAGLDFVVRHHRRGQPAVLNISLGGPASKVADRAVNRVIDDGVTVVTAAGNQGFDACTSSPARVPRAITVGAVNRYDWSPNWSNYGPCVDLFAPGVKIRSAGVTSPTSSRVASGTSMAAPHVAGAAVRYLSAHRDAGPGDVQRHLLASATSVARNAGPDTTRAMLYVRGQVPTTLSSSTSRDWVDPDDRLTIRARLRNRVTGEGLVHRVVLLRRRTGTTEWSRLGTVTTNGEGRASMTHVPGEKSEYRWRHSPTPRTRGSVSPLVDVGFRRWETTLEFMADKGLFGRFTADGIARQGFTVVLYSRSDATTSWTRVEARQTDVDGRVDFQDLDIPGLRYEMRHPGTARTRRAISGVYHSTGPA